MAGIAHGEAQPEIAGVWRRAAKADGGGSSGSGINQGISVIPRDAGAAVVSGHKEGRAATANPSQTIARPDTRNARSTAVRDRRGGRLGSPLVNFVSRTG